MNFDIFIFIIALGSLCLLIYIFLKIRDQGIIEKNENTKFEKKFNDISEELREVGKELTSVTTPINNLNRFLAEKLNIPLIASGGAGELNHLVDAVKIGKADAVLAASIFHYKEISIRKVKEALKREGLEVRL